ncbi:MAG TPA: putative lipid II flippase FtsW [bacterium]|nr:putative lipid II flippase FtsW [bacterium]
MKKISSHLGLFLITLALISIGIIMVYSASAILSLDKYNDSYFFLKRQLAWVFLGLVGMLFAARVNYRALPKLLKPALFFTLLLLILVLFPQFGKEVAGARRWLRMGDFTLQPSELAKLILILYMADTLSRKKEKIKNFTYGFLPPLIILGTIFILILLQPDLGTALIILVVILGMLFVSGVRLKHLFFLFLITLPSIWLLINKVGYRKRRILAFLDPWSDPLGDGYQIIQSLIALGSGGILGRGLGEGTQKLFYLPAPHTDFIFAILGEELGFLGGMAVIILFGAFIYFGARIARRAPDLFGSLLALGITTWIGLQAMINIGVATGTLPTKGIPLPFISFGGSSLIFSLIGVGFLLSISLRSHAPSGAWHSHQGQI